MAQDEAGGPGFGFERIGGGDGMKLLGGAAFIADEEDGRMFVPGMAAGDIRVEALDLVGEADLLQEVERAVDSGRLGRAFAVEIGQQIIRLGGRCALKQEAQYLAANARHPLSAPHDEGFRLIEESIHVLGAARGVCVNVTM